MLRGLNKRLNEARKNESGFTLIELLIVIVILGILAAIVVFSVQGITDKGSTSACKASVETVDTASEAYIANLPGTPPVGGAPALTLSQLSPAFLHSIPTKIGGTAVTGATTVATVDGITC
jgi:general secretion pathway protein G